MASESEYELDSESDNEDILIEDEKSFDETFEDEMDEETYAIIYNNTINEKEDIKDDENDYNKFNKKEKYLFENSNVKKNKKKNKEKKEDKINHVKEFFSVECKKRKFHPRYPTPKELRKKKNIKSINSNDTKNFPSLEL